MIKLGWVVGASLLCWGCAADPGQELDEHRQQWLSKRPQEYVVEICNTGFAPHSCSLDAVSGDRVVASRTALQGQAYEEVEPGSIDPIIALFDRVSSAVRTDDDSDLEFDPQYGYLSKYHGSSGSESSGEIVKCFKPETIDLSACSN
ncbi:MAG TPA: DUF6174 domain-containing protein [Polyangiaceae bacterium]|nr:DUF6174 domain-containing protein [Polyangiaceae bacterium]